MRSSFAILVTLALLGEAAAAPPAGEAMPTCAVLADRSLAGDNLAYVTLVEQRLLASGRVELLDREQVAKALDEKQLQLLFGSGEVARRSAVGKRLRAELLVMIRAVVKPAPAPEVVVSETRRGLRLSTQSVPIAGGAEAGAAAVEGQVLRALGKHAEQIREICAVPPFLSKDLTYQFDYQKRAYAKLVEQMLLERKGVLVVELEEARAIAREFALADAPGEPARHLPLYLLGEYRDEGSGDRRAVTIHLTLKRGEAGLGAASKAGLRPDDVPGWLREAIGGLIAEVDGGARPATDPLAEARQLVARAEDFERLGNWTEAAALTEASLLLVPGQTPIRRKAAELLWKLADEALNPGRPPGPAESKARLELGHRAIEHIEFYLRETRFRPTDSWYAGGPTNPPFTTEIKRWELPASEVELLQAKRAMLLRVLDARLRDGVRDPYPDLLAYAMPWRIGGESMGDAWALILRVLRAIEPLPGIERRIVHYAGHGYTLTNSDGPEFQEFLGKLAESPRPEVRRAVESLRAQVVRDIAGFKANLDKWAVEMEPAVYIALLDRFADSPSRGVREMIAAQRKATVDEHVKVRPPGSPAGIKAVPGDGPEVAFRPLEFTWDAPDGESGKLKALEGLMPAGPGVDLAWTFQNQVFLMKEEGRLRRVFHERNALIGRPGFDGRYAWVPVNRSNQPPAHPMLLVIDPASGRTWTVGAEDGLPFPPLDEPPAPYFRSLMVAPVAPGKACVAGWFGRTWLAMVSIDPAAGKSVKVFHEAREVPDVNLADQWQNAAVAFQPSYMYTLKDGPDDDGRAARRVLIGRNPNPPNIGLIEHPLLVDPGTLKVEPARNKVWPGRVTWRDGAIFWAWPTWTNTNNPAGPDLALFRFGFPDFEKALVTQHVHVGKSESGAVAFDGKRTHIVGDSWWTQDAPGEPFRRLRCEIPEYKVHVEPHLARSAHYGLILIRQYAKPYQVTFPGRVDKP